jgi:tetratricopeptide (TPR) repeat protein
VVCWAATACFSVSSATPSLASRVLRLRQVLLAFGRDDSELLQPDQQRARPPRDFEEAIDAMRQALAAGWNGELDDHPSAQALIADLLLRAGHDQEADKAWAQAEREDPHNPWVHSAASDAYTRVGLYRKALPWQTKGLELALAAGEDAGELAWYLTGARPDDRRPRPGARRAPAPRRAAARAPGAA